MSLSASSGTITRPCPLGITSRSGACSLNDDSTIKLTTKATDKDGDTLLYTYTTTGGRVTGDGSNVSWNLEGVQPGTYTATVEVDDGCGCVAFSSTTVTVADCNDCIPACPQISISCLMDQVSVGQPATVSVNVSGGGNFNVTYNWTVSAGTISGGQGTPSITIDTTGLAGQNVTATVELGGLPPECDRTESCSFSVAGEATPPPRKFDEYSDLRFNDEKARLDNFASQLQQEPGMRGYYVIFGSCEGEADQRSARAVDYLVSTHGIDRNRLVVINGGCRESSMVELYLSAQGAPATANSATVSPCPRCRGAGPRRPRPHRESGSISGIVLDRNNKPISGAIVIAIDKEGEQQGQDVTDENGRFEINDLLPGEYTLRVTYKGIPREQKVNVIQNQIITVPPFVFPIDATTPVLTSSNILRESDEIKVTYYDKFLKGVESDVTLEIARVLREVKPSQNVNTNTGRVEIIDKSRALPGAKDDTITPAINAGDYDTYVRVELSATGLMVPPGQAVQVKLYSQANDDPKLKPKQEWIWSLTPVPGFTGQAEIRFQVNVIWKSKNPKLYPDILHSDAWIRVIRVDIGKPAIIVYGATYGSPLVAIGAFGVGARRRKKLLVGEVEEDDVEDQPPLVTPEADVEDAVTSTAFAPKRARPGDGFLVQVFLHLPEQAALLEEIAKDSDEDAKKADSAKLEKKIKRGTELTLFLEMPGLNIDDPEQKCVWQGELERVRFNVTVPEDFKPKDIIAKVRVAENTIPIGHLMFKTKIVSAAQYEADSSSIPIPVSNMKRYKQAFISYASKDRQEVTKRVQMLNLVKIKYFQDLLTLEPGEPFEKLIYQYIDESDVFFLFWSTAASQSKWVLKEVEYAIKRKTDKDEDPPEIIPVIIEGPPPAKPPTELNFLHFNDRFMYFINSKETEA